MVALYVQHQLSPFAKFYVFGWEQENDMAYYPQGNEYGTGN